MLELLLADVLADAEFVMYSFEVGFLPSLAGRKVIYEWNERFVFLKWSAKRSIKERQKLGQAASNVYV